MTELDQYKAHVAMLTECLQTFIDEHEECTDADDWMASMCSLEAVHVASETLSNTPADSYEEVKKLREQAENSESKLADAYADLGRASTTWTATAVRMLEEQLATAQAEIAKLQAERDALKVARDALDNCAADYLHADSVLTDEALAKINEVLKP